jgi:hypothetical protein
VENLPAKGGTDVGGTEASQPAHLGGEVVGFLVEVRPDRPAGLVELLEEQLEWRSGVVMPLAGELRSG